MIEFQQHKIEGWKNSSQVLQAQQQTEGTYSEIKETNQSSPCSFYLPP